MPHLAKSVCTKSTVLLGNVGVNQNVQSQGKTENSLLRKILMS